MKVLGGLAIKDRRWEKFLNQEIIWKCLKFTAMYKFAGDKIKGLKKPPVPIATPREKDTDTMSEDDKNETKANEKPFVIDQLMEPDPTQ